MVDWCAACSGSSRVWKPRRWSRSPRSAARRWAAGWSSRSLAICASPPPRPGSGLPEVAARPAAGGRRHAAADAAVRPGHRQAPDPRRRGGRRRRGRASRHRPVGAAARAARRAGRASSRRASPRCRKAALAASKRCIAAEGDPRATASPRKSRQREALYDQPETRRRVAEFLDQARAHDRTTKEMP